VVDRVIFNGAVKHEIKLEVDIPLIAAKVSIRVSNTSGHPVRTRHDSVKQRR